MDAPVPNVLMPVWPAHACGLPMRCSCAWTWNFGPVTFDLGDMTWTLCVSDGDGSTPCGALADLVSFLVMSGGYEMLHLIKEYTNVWLDKGI